MELASGLEIDEATRLEQAEATVRDYCGWHIAPSREEVVTFARPSGRRLMLPSLYVTAVTSVTVDGVELVPADFEVHRNGWIERLPGDSLWSGDLVEVTFVHGYTSPPASVMAAVQGLAQAAIDAGGVTRRTRGPFTDVYELPSDTLSRLGKYRIVPVA